MLPPKYNPALFVFQEPTFKHDDALKQVDCIMTVVGVDEEILYSKSHALQVLTKSGARDFVAPSSLLTH